MAAKTTVGAVQNAYLGLWTCFTEAAAKQQLEAKALKDHCGSEVRSGSPCHAHALFVLRKWPYKAVSEKKKLDIVVRVEEVFSKDLSAVVKCTTQIGYYRYCSGQHTSLLEMHYDFEMPVREAHPVFHAQIGPTQWPLLDLEKLGLELRLEQNSAPATYGNTRIPTAYMGFCQVLLALAADHLKPSGYREVVAGAKARLAGLPPVDCGDFGSEVAKGQFPPAHHWYDDKYETYVWQAGKTWICALPLLGLKAMGPSESAAIRALICQGKVQHAQLRISKGIPQKAI